MTLFTVMVHPENVSPTARDRGAPQGIRAVDVKVTSDDLALPPDEFASRIAAPMIKALLQHLAKEAA